MIASFNFILVFNTHTRCFGVATTYLIVVKQLLPIVGEGFSGIPAEEIANGILLNPFICVSIAMASGKQVCPYSLINFRLWLCPCPYYGN